MADIQLSVRDLQKTFHPGLFEASIEVLKGLSFEVARGEIFGFLGPNGAGKTTTIKAITEIIYPDAGEITVCGLPHTALEAKKRIGFMSESPYVYRHLTGVEYLRFSASCWGLIDRASRIGSHGSWKMWEWRVGPTERWEPTRRECCSGWHWGRRCSANRSS